MIDILGAANPLTPSKQIISAIGYARSGKDEFANIAVEEFGYTRFAFADKLRDCLYALNPALIGWYNDRKDKYDCTTRLQDVIKEYGWNGYKETIFGDEIRGLLQRFGTEVGRDLIAEDIWLRELDKVNADKIVITDTRFPNELDYVVSKGGKLVRIHRPGFGPINDHISEVAIDDYKTELSIGNSGTLSQYAENVRSAIRILEAS